jgi:hypothetical protein
MNRRTLLISTAAASISALGGKAVFESAHAQPKAGGGAMPPPSQIGAYMGAPVELAKASNGSITNKKLLDRIEQVSPSYSGGLRFELTGVAQGVELT